MIFDRGADALTFPRHLLAATWPHKFIRLIDILSLPPNAAAWIQTNISKETKWCGEPHLPLTKELKGSMAVPSTNQGHFKDTLPTELPRL